MVAAMPHMRATTPSSDVSAYTVSTLCHVKREVVEQDTCEGPQSNFCIDHPGVQDHRGFSRVKLVSYALGLETVKSRCKLILRLETNCLILKRSYYVARS